MKITKLDIKKWLEEKREYYEGKYMDAEEKEKEDSMQKWDEKIANLDEIENLLEEI